VIPEGPRDTGAALRGPIRAPGRRVRLLAAVLAGGASLALLLGLGAVLYLAWTLPLPEGFQDPGRGAVLMLDGGGGALAARGSSRGGRTDPEALPKTVVAAVLAMEDRRFHEHGGIDPAGVLRAALANLGAGEVRQGGSTLTQQLAKNLFLTPERTFARKVQEALLALWLERRMGKDEILARYLDTVYLGAGAHGIDAAARRYFGKNPKDLTLAEAAMIAGLIQAPSRSAPTRSPEAARQRAEVVLGAMVEAGAITPAEAEAARAKPAVPATLPRGTAGSGHFADWADEEAQRLLGDVAGDFVAETTLDPALQAHAEAVVARWLKGEGAAKGASQAALVAMRPDGAVVAMVGGADYALSQYNRATQARRQPGSLFKLFVYLAALESGLGPDSPVLDAPIRIGDWEPRNYAGRHLGRTDLRTAFAQSLNAAAVRLAEQVGRERVASLARSMGITSPLGIDPSLALGTSEVTLVEITAAYAAVAAGAARVEPHAIRSIRGPGALAYARPAAAADRPSWPRGPMLDLLAATVREGTGKAADPGRAAYGKTGTTQENRDAWFVGFAGDLVVGVWLGNDDNRPMDGVTGGGIPARLWADFMDDAPRGVVPSSPAPPPVPPVAAGPAVPSEPAAAPPAGASPVPAPSAPASSAPSVPSPVPSPGIAGAAFVLDTGTLKVRGRTVRLEGILGEGGAQAQGMADYIAGREVECVPSSAGRHRCEVDGWDLSEVVLFNGGGRATPDAPPDLRAAERKARAARKGIWGGR
jgi:1A family penicillin-binding protein